MLNNIIFKKFILATALIISAVVVISLLVFHYNNQFSYLYPLIKIIIYGITLFFIFKVGLRKIWIEKMQIFSWTALTAILLICLSFIIMQQRILPESISICENITFLIYTLFTGLFEETFFRFFIFYHVLYLLKSQKNKVWKATLITSFFFGIAHFTNAFSGLSLYAVMSLVIFATFMGIIFQGIFLRTNSLIFIGVIHGVLINYFGSYKKILTSEIANRTESFSVLNLIFNLFFFAILYAICVLIIKKYLTKTQLTLEYETEFFIVDR